MAEQYIGPNSGKHLVDKLRAMDASDELAKLEERIAKLEADIGALEAAQNGYGKLYSGSVTGTQGNLKVQFDQDIDIKNLELGSLIFLNIATSTNIKSFYEDLMFADYNGDTFYVGMPYDQETYQNYTAVIGYGDKILVAYVGSADSNTFHNFFLIGGTGLK